MVDLAAMPHLLVAGEYSIATRDGIHVLVRTLFHRVRPERVKLLSVAGRGGKLRGSLELLPHAIHPSPGTLTGPQQRLGWAWNEMERRYRVLVDAGMRHIHRYNELVHTNRAQAEPSVGSMSSQGEGSAELPYMVVIVCDLASIGDAHWDACVRRIRDTAQLSRAVGMHFILVSSDPSRRRVTDAILESCPAHIAFRLPSRALAHRIVCCSAAAGLPPGRKLVLCWPARNRRQIIDTAVGTGSA
jgi:S-DNA-T family DNA segregation ATPase FtsK/SpoIIIE